MSGPTETQLRDARRAVTGLWDDSIRLAYMNDPAFHASTHRLIMAVARIAGLEAEVKEHIEREYEQRQRARDAEAALAAANATIIHHADVVNSRGVKLKQAEAERDELETMLKRKHVRWDLLMAERTIAEMEAASSLDR